MRRASPVREEAMPVSKFKDVFKSEYADILVRDPNLPNEAAGGNEPTVDDGLVGLALSGGGIRSAAFGLGGLQALNQRGVLEQIHYLSTVSGGGYIGTAMTVGMSTGGCAFPFGKTGEDVGETDATKYLRDHSRYLVQNGIWSVLSALVIYLRGITANIVIVLPLMLLVAAAFVGWLPNSNILKTGHEWIGLFAKLPDGFKTLAMPLSLLAAGLTAVLLVIYAIGVSIFPIIPLQKRGALAFGAALVLCAVGLVVLYELHCLLLNGMFDRLGKAPEKAETGVVSFLVSNIKALIAVVVASL